MLFFFNIMINAKSFGINISIKIPPKNIGAVAEAQIDQGDTIISSPGLISAAPHAVIKPLVLEFTI